MAQYFLFQSPVIGNALPYDKHSSHNTQVVSSYLSACWVLFMLLLSSAEFFQDKHFQKKSFGNTIRVTNSLDPEQDRRFVGPDLGTNCLQRLSADVNASKVGDIFSRYRIHSFHTISRGCRLNHAPWQNHIGVFSLSL